MQTPEYQFSTNAIHAGQEPSRWSFHPIAAPISLSTTFQQRFSDQLYSFDYGRNGNPTRQSLEECIARLEKGKYAFAFASGMAATDAICRLLKTGDHIVSVEGLYSGSYNYFSKVLPTFGITTTFCDMRQLDNIKKALKENTRLVWIETPTNPTVKIADIKKISSLCHQHNKDIIIATDNTFMSPYFQNPLLLGSDVVMHSMTKYINGHSDVTMGAVVTSQTGIGEKLKFIQISVGSIPSPFDCYMVLRGLKTLHLRMREHMLNGIAVAEFLESHQCVSRVFYPGLPSHPQHDLALVQCQGFSGMLSFYMKGTIDEGKEFLKNLKVFVSATSFGGCDSLAGIPVLMNQAPILPGESRLNGAKEEFQSDVICKGGNEVLFRLSVGIEDKKDLIEDLDQAFKKSCSLY